MESGNPAHVRRRQERDHLVVLDGWRAISILAVMAGHWFPIGPGAWNFNAAVAASGMALFFCLSGFLITHFLLEDSRVWPFIVKRVTRIVPLAWLAMLILVAVNGADLHTALANLLFFANLPPAALMHGGNHLWSLCVEMQFYLLVATLVAVIGRRALYLLPVLCVIVTGLRIADGVVISIVTWHRLDEILSGAIVALVWHHFGRSGQTARHWVAWLPVLAAVLLVLVANPHAGQLGYLRPYLAALAVGGSLFAFPAILARLFASTPSRYVARTSYALYVVHGMLTATWLGGENADKLLRYVLRVPLVLATFAIAHVSTFFYEARFTNAARRYLAARDARIGKGSASADPAA